MIAIIMNVKEPAIPGHTVKTFEGFFFLMRIGKPVWLL